MNYFSSEHQVSLGQTTMSNGFLAMLMHDFSSAHHISLGKLLCRMVFWDKLVSWQPFRNSIYGSLLTLDLGSYPSCVRVYWAKSCHRGVLIEVLWNRETHKQGEPQDEFCPEAVEVAKLKEPNPCHTCLKSSNTLYTYYISSTIDEK